MVLVSSNAHRRNREIEKVTYAEAPSHSAEAVIVGLKPGRAYQFLVASISAERMLVPGSSIVSNPVKLPEAEYEKAWFFEGGEEDLKWTAFEGLGPDSVGATAGGGALAGGVPTDLDNIRSVLSETRVWKASLPRFFFDRGRFASCVAVLPLTTTAQVHPRGNGHDKLHPPARDKPGPLEDHVARSTTPWLPPWRAHSPISTAAAVWTVHSQT